MKSNLTSFKILILFIGVSIGLSVFAKGDMPGNVTPEDWARYDQLLQTCQSDANSASTSCGDPKSSDGMSQLINSAQSLAAGVGQVAQCGAIADLAQKANLLITAYKATCAPSSVQCQTSCAQAKSFARSIDFNASDDDDFKEANTKCKSSQNNVSQASNLIPQYVQVQQQQAACDAQLAANKAMFCASNPTYPGCPMDGQCLDLACICAQPSGAADPRCHPVAGNMLPNTPGIDSSVSSSLNGLAKSLASGSIGGGDSSFSGNGSTAPTGSTNPQASAAAPNLGGDGGGLPSSPPVPGGTGPTAGPKKTAGYSTGIYSGFITSQGGGGYRGSGSSSDDKSNDPNGNGMGLAKNPRIDLKQFLPGALSDPARGIAGISGPDGITGPNSDIWEKIQNRYNSESDSLVP